MSYDPALGSSLDKARLRLGDTSDDESTEYLPDETYEAAIVEYGDWRLAAAELARSLAARAINEPSSFTAQGDMSVSWSKRAENWLAIAAQLEAEYAAGSATDGPGTETVLTMPFLTGGDYADPAESLSW